MINGSNVDNAVEKKRELLMLADLYTFGVNSLSPARRIWGQAFPFYKECIIISQVFMGNLVIKWDI